MKEPSSADAEVEYQEADGVAVLTLAAPQRRNALTPEMADSIVARLERAESNSNIGALVVAANGPSFSAGADRGLLRSVAADPLANEAYESLGRIYQLFVRLQASAIPTICAVNGAVIGASVNLALSCDLRLVSEDVRIAGFGVAGLHPGGGHLRLLARALSLSTAAGLALFGLELDANAAVASGFALLAVQPSQLRSEAIAIALRAGGDPALSRRITATWRSASVDVVSPQAAVQLERAAQLWSLRRQG